MWQPIWTKEQIDGQEDQVKLAFLKSVEEAEKKTEARESWLKANTCPHCGQHPPLPPWLM